MSRLISAHTLIALLASTLVATPTVQAQTTWYVDDDASLGGDGTSWPTAFKYLQDALEVAVSTDEIRVGAGTYEPDQDEAGNVTPGDREATFQLVNRVGLYGGYAGLSDPNSPDNRDIGLYESRLSGDLNGNDDPNDPNSISENSYHVVTGSSTSATTVLDGFTITAGNASTWHGTVPLACGGGVLVIDAAVSIASCLLKNNIADHGGGLHSVSSDLTLKACNFVENYASGSVETSYGGGMASFDSTVTLANCTFTANRVGFLGGGGLYQDGGDVTLLNCVFTGNVGYCGGAICVTGWLATGTCTLSGCTIAANTACDGGGVYCNDSSPTLTNCILWDDTPDEIYVYSGDPVATYCDVEGGWPGEGNIDADPQFVDPNSGDYHVSAGSPCIDAGDTTAVPCGLFVDLDGRGRVLDDPCTTPDTGVPAPIVKVTVDMGAYEFQLPGDVDYDGDVDLADLAALLAVYGTTCP